MEHPTATLDDTIIDNATLAAIQAAQADYPSFLTAKALTQAAEAQAHEAITPANDEDGTQRTTLYVGVFIAAYQLRSRSLLARPTDSQHTSL